MAIASVLVATSCNDAGQKSVVLDGDTSTAGFYTFVVQVADNCSGTLITTRHVATAGHCVCPEFPYTDPNNPNIVARRDAQHCQEVSGITVFDSHGQAQDSIASSGVTVHPDFHINFELAANGHDHVIVDQMADVAIIELAVDVPLEFGFVPIATEQPGAGVAVTMVGFGVSTEQECLMGGGATFGTRRVGTNQVDSVSDDLVTVQEDAKNLTAPGDSGGALLASATGSLRLIGVTSSGNCQTVAEYTNVASYAGWINGVIASTQGIVCGNLNCQEGETAATCCVDCGCPGGQVCDGNICKVVGDACAEAADGIYCGSALEGYAGSIDDLVSCQNAHIAWASNCAVGCNPLPGNDTCNNDGPGPQCNNGVLEAGEECDGVDLGGQSCANFNFVSGTLACTGTCLFDKSQCCNDTCPTNGANQCANSSTQQTCGQYDNDVCLEWGGSTQCNCTGGACATTCTDTYSIGGYVCESYTAASGSGAGGGEIFVICASVNASTGFVTIKVHKKDGSAFSTTRPYQIRVSGPGDVGCGPDHVFTPVSTTPTFSPDNKTLTFNFQSNWQSGQTEKFYCATASTQSGDASYDPNSNPQKSWWYSKKIQLQKSCQ